QTPPCVRSAPCLSRILHGSVGRGWRRTSNPKCHNRRMQTNSALAFGVRELAPAFASTGSFESAGSPHEITGAGPGNAIGWNISWGKPVTFHASRFAHHVSRFTSHASRDVPNVPSCHGCHGLPRLVPRVESDKTLDFIGLPRVPRPFTPLGVGA